MQKDDSVSKLYTVVGAGGGADRWWPRLAGARPPGAAGNAQRRRAARQPGRLAARDRTGGCRRGR